VSVSNVLLHDPVQTVTGNLHLAEFSAQCVAEAHTIHTDYSVDQLSSSLDAFVR
jgi:hypothetical protein